MKTIITVLMLLLSLSAGAQDYKTVKDISYSVKTDDYSREQLKLDVYYPEHLADCPVVIWFHGGGLEGGRKEIPYQLSEKGMVVVGVEYRLLPKVSIDDVLDDAAEAVAWVFRHAAEYHGDTTKVIVSGHSAGGYLTMMLALNTSLLERHGVDADSVMLYVPFCGQAITHFSVRKMRGIRALKPVIDEYAPLYWVRRKCPPLVLITGDRELELYGRYDENQYLARMMKLVGHKQTYLYELGGHGHGSMVTPAFHILNTHIQKALGQPVWP